MVIHVPNMKLCRLYLEMGVQAKIKMNKITHLWVGQFVQRYQLYMPCLAFTTQHHSIERVNSPFQMSRK